MCVYKDQKNTTHLKNTKILIYVDSDDHFFFGFFGEEGVIFIIKFLFFYVKIAHIFNQHKN